MSSHNSSFTLRQLTDRDLTDYLALRLVAFRKIGWVDPQATLVDMKDSFEDLVISFGVFSQGLLIAGIRIIVTKGSLYLPAGRYLPESEAHSERSAELTRGVIDPLHQHLGLFPLLVLHSTIKAIQLDIRHIYATVLNLPNWKLFGRKYGFHDISRPFLYRDGIIAPPSESIILKQLSFGSDKIESLIAVRNQLALATLENFNDE